MSELTDKQAEMDKLELEIIANKNQRNELREAAKELRDEYLALQVEREALLFKENMAAAEETN